MRLTNEQLALGEKFGDADTRAMAQELRERRAGDLGADDMRALRWAHQWLSLEGYEPRSVTNQQVWRLALAVLDRLLASGVKP